jgi:hypothetical protein
MIELEIAVLPLRARPPIYNIKSKNMVGSYDKHWLAGTEVVPRATKAARFWCGESGAQCSNTD